jgi:hypothetical protein
MIITKTVETNTLNIRKNDDRVRTVQECTESGRNDLTVTLKCDSNKMVTIDGISKVLPSLNLAKSVDIPMALCYNWG